MGMPMRLLSVRRARNPSAAVAFEGLEARRFLSTSVINPLDTANSPVTALSITASAGKRFHDAVGNWTIASGVPDPKAGVIALAIVDWGDGKTSHAKFVDDGSGVVQIVGTHAWSKSGTFQTTVKVEEFSKKQPRQITDIGDAGGTAVVAPKPHATSVKGTLTGTYTTPLGNPDARSYVFTGTGTAGSLGTVNVSGIITPPGFIRTAPATGELTMTGATGTATLSLTGHTQPGGSALPQNMKFVISSGTGLFANAGGKGSVSIALDTTANTFVMVVR